MIHVLNLTVLIGELIGLNITQRNIGPSCCIVRVCIYYLIPHDTNNYNLAAICHGLIIAKKTWCNSSSFRVRYLNLFVTLKVKIFPVINYMGKLSFFCEKANLCVIVQKKKHYCAHTLMKIGLQSSLHLIDSFMFMVGK